MINDYNGVLCEILSCEWSLHHKIRISKNSMVIHKTLLRQDA